MLYSEGINVECIECKYECFSRFLHKSKKCQVIVHLLETCAQVLSISRILYEGLSQNQCVCS